MATRQRGATGGLRAGKWERFLRAPDAQLLESLYVPALSRALTYDRCCAYFSSRVLAVAARGFGRLIENLLALGEAAPKPAVRLLVNEQLDAADLASLLATGDQTALTEKLLKQLTSPKDALERNRLEMLAWLVAQGLLAVRVGVMRTTKGISHAKFGLITDRRGDSLVFMGSDNETGEALVENYEELELRPSWKDREFADYYRQRFEALWEDQDDHVMTLPLPEAVARKLIKLAPEEPPQELLHDAPTVKAAAVWHFLAASPYLPNGEYACDATALVDMWPHQRRVVEDTAGAFPTGRLLCDEVGMGKTIEAILVLRRLLAGRGVARALLLVPAGLLRQWQDELREKGGLLVPRWEDGYLCQPDGTRTAVEPREVLATSDVLLLSREWARLDQNRELLLSAPRWDLVLLDEAHAARRSFGGEREFNSGNLLLQLLRDLQLRGRARGLLLLSATPMQTQPWEPWDLLSTLGVGGEWMVEFDDIRGYYRGVALLRRGPMDREAATTTARLVASDGSLPPLEGLTCTEAAPLREALRFASPAKCRLYSDWLRRGSPLGQRMHRNTRDTLRAYHRAGLLDSCPPSRQVVDESFDYQYEGERACYDAVEHYIDERYSRLEEEKPGKGFVMTVYRRRAASSPRALRETLRRRLEGLEGVIKKAWLGDWSALDPEYLDSRDLSDAGIEEKVDPALPTTPKAAAAEKEEVLKLLERLEELGSADSKFDKFWSVLQDISGDGRSVLVFTEYLDTLKHLRDRMVPTYGSTLGCFSGDGGEVWGNGKWVPVSKADITERLGRGELRVLVCTDAASEGLNLQAASALVNYDLPWNPSKVEQRIGRIDRIGQQQQELPIRNLFLRDSIDMQVYLTLRYRCGLFEHFVGRMQPVLALAREALRTNPSRIDIASVIAELEKRAKEVTEDEAVASTFASASAVAPIAGTTPVTRGDIEQALDDLARCQGSVKAKRVKGQRRWRVGGLGGKTVEVTTDREVLERERHVAPATIAGDLAPRLASRLPLPSHLPLVLAEATAGPFRCVEARWVGAEDTVAVSSMQQLRALLDAWDGTAPPPGRMIAAEEHARASARRRAEALQRQAATRERAGLEHQLEACRLRLRRELGRTLRCAGSGDLTALFRGQVQRESRTDGRYHRAWGLLNGAPGWPGEEVRDIDDFVRQLSAKDRQARINLMAEVDAALNDPRWRVREMAGHSV